MEQHGFHRTYFQVDFYWRSWRKFKFCWNLSRITVLFMKTYVGLWWYLAEFFLEWEIFTQKSYRISKTHNLFSGASSEKHAVYEMMWKKCGRVKEDTDNNIIRCMRISGLTTKVTYKHWEYVILTAISFQTMVTPTLVNITFINTYHDAVIILSLYRVFHDFRA